MRFFGKALLLLICTAPSIVLGQKIQKFPRANTAFQKEVERLVGEQKYKQAKTYTDKYLSEQKGKNEFEYTRALLERMQLQIGLHSYETAVKELKAAEWPKNPSAKALLDLYYASSLINYFNSYSWEIQQREEVVSSDEVELKKWTKDQIQNEINKSFSKVWKLRKQLGDIATQDFAEFFRVNDYPAKVRPTMRDALSYLFAGHLVNSSFWSPKQANGVYYLDQNSLLRKPKKLSEKNLASDKVHPLEKMAFVLHNLADWHKKEGNWQAYSEAQVTNVGGLTQHFQLESAKRNSINYLRRVIKLTRANSWKGRVYNQLGLAMMSTGSPTSNIDALKVLDGCIKVHKRDESGKYCVATRAQILAPNYTLDSMLSDGVSKDSITVTYKNINKLYFRAYRLDLKKQVLGSRRYGNYTLVPDYEEIKSLMKSAELAKEWQVDLKKTADYKQHTRLLSPGIEKKGLYLIMASANSEFSVTNNVVRYLSFIRTNIVLIKQSTPGAQMRLQTVDGETGKPLSGANVRLYQRLNNDKPKLNNSAVTGKDGFVTLGNQDRSSSRDLFILAQKGKDVTVEAQGSYLYKYSQPKASYRSLLYTDRSIYRPGQKVFFKVLGFRGDAARLNFSTTKAKGKSVEVRLRDQNYKEVSKLKVKLNDFGTASGEFVIPKGRALGSWRVEANLSGLASSAMSIKVEEYKRPTFEVSLSKPKSALRLNRQAIVKGNVNYYFGLPVTEGEVKYKVTRAERYPWWWGWCFVWGWGGQKPPQIVASGKSKLNNKGEFEVPFMPKVAKANDNPSVNYDFTISVDVTDIGGETRSSSSSYTVGRVAVTASIVQIDPFVESNEAVEFLVNRTSLNGLPLGGDGQWSLYSINQPAKTRNASDELKGLPPGQKLSPYAHKDDRRQSRWTYQASDWRPTVFHWPTGKRLSSGKLKHDQGGAASFNVQKLESGFYRLKYSTKDEFGASFEQRHDFYVAGKNLNFPLLLQSDQASYEVGETARVFLHSGFKGQAIRYQVVREEKVLLEGVVKTQGGFLEIPITESLRGGFAVQARFVNDYQLSGKTSSIYVNWTNKVLNVEFKKFRDKIRPGQKESFEIKLATPEGQPVLKQAAEVLAYMYDRSLDAFYAHMPPNPMNIYGNFSGASYPYSSNLATSGSNVLSYTSWARLPDPPYFTPDQFKSYSRYGIGGLGSRYRGGVKGSMGAVDAMDMEGSSLSAAEDLAEAPASRVAPKKKSKKMRPSGNIRREKQAANKELEQPIEQASQENDAEEPVRQNFSETAFWVPSLKSNKKGEATISFEVPDSVTDWNVWVHAITRDLMTGRAKKTTKSVKDLMVRPYLPRFFREADKAELKIVVNNASDKDMDVVVSAELFDPETKQSLLRDFGIKDKNWSKNVKVEKTGSSSVTLPLVVPSKIGEVAFKVTAKTKGLSDGELRTLPILPSRMHLLQSKFVTLRKGKPRSIDFEQMRDKSDKSLIHKKLVLTLDAQLFYSVLTAVPYLVDYPYLCTEQTLNRFISTSILHQMFKKYPSVSKMAAKMAKARDTQYEKWNKDDPNRLLFLEETPWLNQAEGGAKQRSQLIKALDPKIAKGVQAKSLKRLKSIQTSDGGFPWFPGGRPSEYITMYVVHGFAKATEFGAKLPKDMVVKAWRYLHNSYTGSSQRNRSLYFLVFTNYLASTFPDESWTGGFFTKKERISILNYTFEKWKELSPYLKAYLALTLHRMDRKKDAKLVFDSIMDSSTTTEDQGTFWAAEDRAWLWYNDTIEGHAYALRAMMEIDPNDSRREGLVQWLFLNKKLGHWKSTRATAEVLYSLVKYLDQEKQLGNKEQIKASIGKRTRTFDFQPDEYSGKSRQWLIDGPEIEPVADSKITIEKTDSALGFASATWHFSTEKLPQEGVGDFIQVTRKYYHRKVDGEKMKLVPLKKGDAVAVGDEVEIQIGISIKHQFEYVHLRDPRPAGFEPGVVTSGWEWDLGLPRYKEIRDSATNFFIEWLPQGQYTLKYRVKAAMAGKFRVGPARIQSMYAPEFGAYSSVKVIKIK